MTDPTAAARRPHQITVEVAHHCGVIHEVTGWTTATPGLVVVLDGPPNTECRLVDELALHVLFPGVEDPEHWVVWQLPGYEVRPGELTSAGVVMFGMAGPEDAMQAAWEIGEHRAGRLSIVFEPTDVLDATTTPLSDEHNPLEVPAAAADELATALERLDDTFAIDW